VDGEGAGSDGIARANAAGPPTVPGETPAHGASHFSTAVIFCGFALFRRQQQFFLVRQQAFWDSWLPGRNRSARKAVVVDTTSGRNIATAATHQPTLRIFI
jgi:hypothetical protein